MVSTAICGLLSEDVDIFDGQNWASIVMRVKLFCFVIKARSFCSMLFALEIWTTPTNVGYNQQYNWQCSRITDIS